MPDDSTPNSGAASLPVRRASKVSSPPVKASAGLAATGPIEGPKAFQATVVRQKQKPVKNKVLQLNTTDPGPSSPNTGLKPAEPRVKEFKPLNPSPSVGNKSTQPVKSPQQASGEAVRPSKGVPPSVPPISSPERRQGLPEPSVKGGGRQSAVGLTKGSKTSPVTALGGIAELLSREAAPSAGIPPKPAPIPDRGVNTWSAFWTPDMDQSDNLPAGASPSFR